MNFGTQNTLLIALFVILTELPALLAKANYVTCGSIVKLINADNGFRLHSHDVKYGSGSGQQSVTGIDLQEDVNSHWVIKGPDDKVCDRGEPIKCGEKIRFEHLTTKRNLHSHHYSSPLSGEQEVSAFGENGVGDTGDNWEVVCSNDAWQRDENVRIRHIDTSAYLSISGRSFGRPISGQMEVVGVSGTSHGTRWLTAEGLYIMSKEKETEYAHTEL